MVLLSSFPPDIRLEKEFRTLRKEHEVVLLCQKRGSQSAEEMWEGVQIRRVLNPVERRWSNWRLMTTCCSSIWLREIDSFVKKCRLDVLHVHDLPLVGTALTVAKRHLIPLVADLHENYPAMLEEGTRRPIGDVRSVGSLVSRLSVSVPRWKAYESAAVPQASSVIVVIDEARDRLVDMGLSRENVHVVGNFASLDEVREPKKDNQRNVPFRVIYAGGFDHTRDLDTVISAVEELPEADFADLEVQLVGGTGRALKKARQCINARKLQDRIVVSEWMPLREVEHIMDNADTGLVPHVKSPHTDATVPHKLFQYMARSLSVIVSNCAPLERVVRNTGCGMIYTSGDPDSLAKCISTMYADRERVREMGLAGREAVTSQYNWEKAAESLLSVYREIAAMRNDGVFSASQ